MIMAMRRYIGSSIARQFVAGLVAVQVVLTIAISADLVRRQIANADATRVVRAQGLVEMLAGGVAGPTCLQVRIIHASHTRSEPKYSIVERMCGVKVLAHLAAYVML